MEKTRGRHSNMDKRPIRACVYLGGQSWVSDWLPRICARQQTAPSVQQPHSLSLVSSLTNSPQIATSRPSDRLPLCRVVEGQARARPARVVKPTVAQTLIVGPNGPLPGRSRSSPNSPRCSAVSTTAVNLTSHNSESHIIPKNANCHMKIEHRISRRNSSDSALEKHYSVLHALQAIRLGARFHGLGARMGAAQLCFVLLVFVKVAWCEGLGCFSSVRSIPRARPASVSST